MAINTLLIRTQRTIGSGQNIVILDAVIKETVKSDITATNNPIETGAIVTDHAIVQPKKYTLEGVVTDTPRISEGISTAIVDNITGLFGSSTDEGRSRSNSAYLTLVRLQESRIPFDILTGFQEFKNVIITNITSLQDKNTSKAFFFTASLLEIKIVSTEIINVTAESVKTPQGETGAPTPENAGTVQKTPQSTGSFIKRIKDNGLEETVKNYLGNLGINLESQGII